MSKAARIWLIVAACLTVFGAAVFAVTAKVFYSFSELETGRYETVTYEVNDSFQSIMIETDISDISLCPSADGACRVVCSEQDKLHYEVSVQNGTLSIELKDVRQWLDSIGINDLELTVFLPETEYSSLTIKDSTGDIDIPGSFSFRNADIILTTGDLEFAASVAERLSVEGRTGELELKNLSADTIEISVSTGEVSMENVQCRTFSSSGSTGELELENVTATDKLSVERSTGDVRFEHCDAGEIFVHTSTGDILGTLLTDKVFIVDTSTGDVRVPETTSGGKCKLITSTGDISIKIA